LAVYTPIGVEVTRHLVSAKIAAQRSVAARLPGGARLARELDALILRAEEAASIAEALDAEALAANIYWTAWAGVRVEFARRDAPRVPEHWQLVGARVSPVAKDRRHAITPAHAILNYLYRLLEAETTLSLHAAGLDPAIGVFHRDERYRDSLSLDVMEPARPIADAHLLDLLQAQPLRRSDFHETERGVVRLLPPLTHQLAETLPHLRAAIEPHTLAVARMLDRDPTLLAGTLTFNAAARRSEHKRTPPVREARPHEPHASCPGCGSPLPPSNHDTCGIAPRAVPTATGANRTAAKRSRLANTLFENGTGNTPHALTPPRSPRTCCPVSPGYPCRALREKRASAGATCGMSSLG
jgi:hypothetical protein